eukprot:756113-Hanusia_phi.AAC.3
MAVTGEVEMEDGGGGGGGGGGGERQVFCLSNEHLFVDQTPVVKLLQDAGMVPSDLLHAPLALENRGKIMQSPLCNLDNAVLNKAPMAEHELRSFKAAGGSLIVDTTVAALGRNPRMLRKLSKLTGVHVVMGTGFGVQVLHPHYLAEESTEEVAKKMEREVVGGCVESDAEGSIRAGIIGGIGVSRGFHEEERRVVAAAGRAQARTGAPLFIDLEPGCKLGLEVMEVVASEGADLKKTVMMNMSYACEDREYVRAVLSRGCNASFDSVGSSGEQEDVKFAVAVMASLVVCLDSKHFVCCCLLCCLLTPSNDASGEIICV